MQTLYIGNKNYSSWSLRAWLLLRHLGLPFQEHLVSVAGREYNPDLKPLAGNAKVPCLHTTSGFQIWESIAIAEYLAETHPQLWPSDPLARARARSLCAELHAGFGRIRNTMPMNIKLHLRPHALQPEVQREVDRVIEIWTEARTHTSADQGPWLFGQFSVADAMFAPVAFRFDTYAVPLPPMAQSYQETLLAHPSMQEWKASALAETETLAALDALADTYGLRTPA